jgi:hypothetical protein
LVYVYLQLLYLLDENFPLQPEIPVFFNGKFLAAIHIGEKLTELLSAMPTKAWMLEGPPKFVHHLIHKDPNSP